MTFKYNNVFVLNTATIAGPYEKDGPIGKYFDTTYTDLYFKEKSWEKAEIKLSRDSINKVLTKTKTKKNDIDVVIGGDLLNQIAASCYGALDVGKSFLGIYGACSTSVEGMIIASTLIDGGRVKNALVVTSSHNMSSEKQFRNPTEYGAPKPHSATFTATGGASIILTNKKTNIKVESSTIGKIIDKNQNDPNNMGAVMAGAAADTIARHLEDLKRTPDYYDLILTGDLGLYGKQMLIDYLKETKKIDIQKNYNDCGVILYNLKQQEECLAGGSGPVCGPLVVYSLILDQLKTKKLRRVLFVATGALFSPTTIYQKENILSIANAISLEVC